jgi:hypothetical protein
VLQARPAPPRLGNGTRPVYDAVLATVEPLARSASSATVVETVRRRLLELV